MSLLDIVKENIEKNKDIKRELFNIDFVSPEIQNIKDKMDVICDQIAKKYNMKY